MKKELGLMAGAALLLAGAAHGDFDINILTNNPSTGYTEDLDILGYEFGTTTDIGPGVAPFLFYITVSSQAGTGWDYEIVFDYTEYDVGFFTAQGTSQISITDLVDDFEVADAQASFGNLSFDANSISWDASVADILGANEIVTISWNAVPAPGALALLGVAGLIGASRRRR